MTDVKVNYGVVSNGAGPGGTIGGMDDDLGSKVVCVVTRPHRT